MLTLASDPEHGKRSVVLTCGRTWPSEGPQDRSGISDKQLLGSTEKPEFEVSSSNQDTRLHQYFEPYIRLWDRQRICSWRGHSGLCQLHDSQIQVPILLADFVDADSSADSTQKDVEEEKSSSSG